MRENKKCGSFAVRRYPLDMEESGPVGLWHPAPKAIAGIPHPIPYQGSKRRLASLIVAQISGQCGRLVEPFAGSAAVSLAAAHLCAASHFLLNDLHSPLIDLWHEIIDRPDELASQYRRLWNEQASNPRIYYDKVRARFNKTRQPADFLYLLARCVKAAIRYNSRGEFNNSPDNRRLGSLPDTMSRHVQGASVLLRGRTELCSGDYRSVLERAKETDVVYMDPPYQGVCNTHNHRYAHGVSFHEFISALADLNARRVPFILSYDGRTGDKRFGQPLPASLEMRHIEIRVGRSTQATLLGRDHCTYESLYVSPALLTKFKPKSPLEFSPCLFAEPAYGRSGRFV